MPHSDIEEIIIRSIIGTVSPSELQMLSIWRKSTSNNDLSYQLLKQTWEQSAPAPQHPEYESLENHILTYGFDQPVLQKKTVTISQAAYKVAAVVILICVAAWVSLRSINSVEIPEESLEHIVTYNPTGHKSKITLPDNSVIYLNSESTLSYQKGFTDSIRYVELKGEAFFEVEPDAKRPFVVETCGIQTTALGTSFNIRNYPEDNSINVSLLTGKVKVTDSRAANEVFLKPLEQVAIDKKGRTLKTSKLKEDHQSIWKDGTVYFQASNFEQVIKTLERTYDVNFDTSGYSERDWSYTGKFDNMSLEIVLTRIGYSEGFTSQIDGRKIRIIDIID